MDFYKFTTGIASLEKLVTAIYPTIISEFERRFGVNVEEASVEIYYHPHKIMHEIRVVIRCEKGKFYIPIAVLRDTTPVLYGIEQAFRYMMPPFPQSFPQ